jgi:hypothetical protein
MTEAGGVQKNTAYGVFVQACWAQHKRQYPDELIHKEIEEFNKQCSVWWYNLSEQERDRFQEMADRSNAQQAAINQAYTVQSQPNNIVTTVQTNSGTQQQIHVTNAASGSSNVGIPSFGSSFSYSDYGIQGGQQGQVVNAVVDNSGQVLNYSTNAGGQTVMRQVTQVQQQQQQQQVTQVQQQAKVVTAIPGQQTKVNQKPIKDPNAPKKPLSAYFLFSQEERLKVKAENPDYSITEVAKELGRRWATLNPALKTSYEQRYQDARKVYDQEMNHYKPQKKKKDPNAPKQPLSAYFIFSTEERLKVKEENANYSICEVAKELGRRWADMDPSVKQRYQARAEEERQKYDVDMASYRQGTFSHPGQERVAVGGQGSPVNMNQHPSPAPSPSYGVQQQQQQTAQDYANLLQ